MKKAIPKRYLKQAMSYALVTTASIIILLMLLILPAALLFKLAEQKESIWLGLTSGVLGSMFSLLTAGFILAGSHRAGTALKKAFLIWESTQE